MGVAEVEVTVDGGERARRTSRCSAAAGSGGPGVRRARRAGGGGRDPGAGQIVLDFDHYGRLAGIRVEGSADSVLSPSLLGVAA